MDNIDNLLNKLDKQDLLLLGNKDLLKKNDIFQSIEYVDLRKDFKKYKKQIKEKINNLFASYLDVSGDIKDLINSNNDTIKCDNYFYFFIYDLIENIKHKELDNLIQKDITEYTNNSISKKKLDKNVNMIPDLSNSLNSYATINVSNINDTSKICSIATKELYSTKLTKENTLNEFVNITNKRDIKKILPKQRI